MTNALIDNSVEGLEVVLWQYDHAPNFLNMVKAIIGEYRAATEDFWDSFEPGVFDLRTATTFGLAVWGILLGKGRATYKDQTGAVQPISDGLYRRVLLARLGHLNGDRSMADILGYLHEVFEGRVLCTDNLDMSLTHKLSDGTPVAELKDASRLAELLESDPWRNDAETLLLLAQDPDYLLVFPAGVRERSVPHGLWFGFSGQEAEPDGGAFGSFSNFGPDRPFFSGELYEAVKAATPAVASRASPPHLASKKGRRRRSAAAGAAKVSRKGGT